MPGCRNCKREFSSVKAWEYHDCVSVEQQQAQLITRLTEALESKIFCPSCDHDYCQLGNELLTILRG